MIPEPPPVTYPPGTRVRVVKPVRVGSHRWLTQIIGTVEAEQFRPVGGMEMGPKSLYTRQPCLHLRLQDGERTMVTIDQHARIEVLS